MSDTSAKAAAAQTGRAALPVWTADRIADYLTDGYWAYRGNGVSRSFAVASGDSLTVNLEKLPAAERYLAQSALDAWSVATGIRFSASKSAAADILFSNEGASANGGQRAYYPSTGEIVQSFVTVGSGWIKTNGSRLSDYSFKSYLHEIGHALGIGHAGPYNGKVSFGSAATYANDSTLMSVMSYFSPSENPYFGRAEATAVTPMIADLVAMRSLYGPTSAHAGTTVWGANSNVGGYLGQIFSYSYDGQTADPAIFANKRIAFTVQDSSGRDTLDFSTVRQDQTIDLREGMFSTVGARGDRMGIAIGTVIENATGGAGNDQITGNAVANTLLGTKGNDTIDGGAGNDILQGGEGDDRLLGGAGNDRLLGQTGRDRLDGGTGNDLLFGGQSADTLIGGAGNDTLYGEGGADQMAGGTGADTFVFQSIAESRTASTARDTISDFSGRQGDLIDLRLIDADTTLARDQSFDFIGTAAFHGEAGELRASRLGSGTLVEGDVNGDGRADFAIYFLGGITFAESDFLL